MIVLGMKTLFQLLHPMEYLEVLKWLKENGCPWDDHYCAFATQNGHLKW